MPFRGSVRKVITAVLLAAAFLGAGCANKQAGLDGGLAGGGAGVATPGSAQDFQVNVGDRVFFESDQTSLTKQAVACLLYTSPSPRDS